jgi:hypothetical protein
MVRDCALMAANLALFAFALLAPRASADERLAGIACRSVHLKFPAPEGTAFSNEITIDESSEGTYFCVCGFNQGYFGLQELANGKKVVIFSIWDPGRQDDPNSVAEDRRVKLVSKDDAVRIGRFGNEGTGGQSFLDYDWKPGATYKFLVTAKIEGDRTAFAAYFSSPEAKAWRHLVTFSTLAGGKRLGGYYAFIEDFRRNRISATRERRARFGEGWVWGADGRWVALTRARFTADRNPAENIDAGVAGDRFFLATGGKTENTHVHLGQEIDRPPGEMMLLP